ncbi:MAG TPA: hypothetical protein VMC07_03300 [Candidatus Omnitrophota bacterium]|nr:hypothetical protein [Candidatus Omnitrophota bacterium]
MPPPLDFLFPHEIGMELIYSFVIIFCSLMIYRATKEMYELSSYKGIKYFRMSFLFFAIAYFFRYFINFFLVLFASPEANIFSGYIFLISLFVFMYSSAMAVFYLLYSVMWKKWNHSRQKIYLFSILSAIIAIIGTLFRGIEVSLLLNLIFLIFAFIILLIAYKDSKKKHKEKSLFAIYLLLFIFWVLNVIDILLPKFLQVYQILIYLASISLFMIILYKVLKKAGSD